MKKIYIVLAMLACVLSIQAKGVYVVNVEEGQDISEALTQEWYHEDSLVVNGFLSHDNLKALIKWCAPNFRSINLENCQIEDDVLPEQCFKGYWGEAWSGAETLRLPKTLKKVCFQACAYSGFKAIVLPDGLEEIGNEAFAFSRVESAAVPEGIETILPGSFAYCRNIRSLTLPSTLKTVCTEAFIGLEGLTTLTLPDGVEFVGDRAFFGLRIATLRLPYDLKIVGHGSFAFNPNLRTVYAYNPVSPVSVDLNNSIDDAGATAKASEVFTYDGLTIYGVMTPFQSIHPDATLYLPKGSSESYLVYSGLGLMDDFCHVVPMDPQSYPTSVRQLAAADGTGHEVVAADGGIVVRGSGAAFSVCLLNGQQVAAGTAEGERRIALPRGIYVVKTGREARKIAVR